MPNGSYGITIVPVSLLTAAASTALGVGPQTEWVLDLAGQLTGLAFEGVVDHIVQTIPQSDSGRKEYFARRLLACATYMASSAAWSAYGYPEIAVPAAAATSALVAQFPNPETLCDALDNLLKGKEAVSIERKNQ